MISIQLPVMLFLSWISFTRISVAIFLLILFGISVILAFVISRWRSFLLMTALFALLNSVIAAPQNWGSFVKGREFRFTPISPTSPPIPISRLALPIDSPEVIIEKMGCHVCHKIPSISTSWSSSFGPLLIPKTMAPLRLTSPEYQERIKAGTASATTPREYVIESIINPDAFIVPGFENRGNPEKSLMYRHYSKRFTSGAVEVLVDFLLTLDVESAMRDGLMFSH